MNLSAVKVRIFSEVAVCFLSCILDWRRGWDSNPRAPCEAAGFQDQCNRPLCHPSNVNSNRTRTCFRGIRPMVLAHIRYHFFSQMSGCASVHTPTAFARPHCATCCRGTRIRTLTDGFGDHNATIIPYLCNIVSPTAAPLSGICIAVVGVTIAFTYGNLSDLSKSCFLCVRCRTQLQRYNFISYLQSLFRLFRENLFLV